MKPYVYAGNFVENDKYFAFREFIRQDALMHYLLLVHAHELRAVEKIWIGSDRTTGRVGSDRIGSY